MNIGCRWKETVRGFYPAEQLSHGCGFLQAINTNTTLDKKDGKYFQREKHEERVLFLLGRFCARKIEFHGLRNRHGVRVHEGPFANYVCLTFSCQN